MSAAQSNAPLNYEDAGYNRFFRRTLNSNVSERSLKNVGAARMYNSQDINFDGSQTSGSVGDMFRVKNVTIDGNIGLKIHDPEGNEVVRVGNMEY